MIDLKPKMSEKAPSPDQGRDQGPDPEIKEDQEEGQDQGRIHQGHLHLITEEGVAVLNTKADQEVSDGLPLKEKEEKLALL